MSSGAGLPVLTYHALDTSRSVLATDPSWFSETMAALCEAGFRAVDLDEWIAQGRPEVPRGFAVTFDDGLASMTRGADVLTRHGIPSTAFLVTDRVGGDNAWPGQPRGIPRMPLLGWSDLAALGSLGVRFAAHSRTHPRLSRCDDATIEAELRGSREAIEDRTGMPCRLFSYPYGVTDRRVRRAASGAFSAAFTASPGYARGGESAFLLSRVDAHDLRTPRALRLLIEGRLGPMLRALRVVRGARRAAIAWVGS